jgi:hypothetical protein
VNSYARHCDYCGAPVTEDEGRWCDDCDDVARHDPLAPASIDLVLFRRMRRTATRLIEYMDHAERLARQKSRA